MEKFKCLEKKLKKNKHQLSTLENPNDVSQTPPQKFIPFQQHIKKNIPLTVRLTLWTVKS